jgi:2-oxoglutarate ferredoxin oxidoreductase subunit delta
MMNTTQERPTPGEDAVAQVALDRDLCKACGICIDLCPESVYDRDKLGYPVVARADDCVSCLLCELHCPDFAIEVQRRGRKTSATPEEIAEAERERVRVALASRPDDDERPVTGSECGVHGGGDD